ncbi:Pre-mRNA-splicing factor cwc26 [Exophiala dermatitidis]|uniref:Pre-mRNA-splicing factor CWC26 n=2 Tax=Exophiala dermatitidis TaxID=5970 RepID=H6C5R8_EXODN|nr:uncharacterized protein HMPREF1120_07063 [Exophiala dermatitidis NIH/UT8656]KAJ4516338.1 Pre-mRNA-splicing factor cwc26 [Exophiala dermatitidis]EHY59064.1 hypothetical protein HMPREF1120_07063 [Exophiala dermatitidis NIH/UT8656]KAJ4526473.1 Pre-mRNA-splicing factor cwc26 [Exophiala dermatitidis]KAJ4532281.1 Pre-mRNA-splicing factor cwc26 [Exophiala dermatitidis]KAJ4546318.1 Pre-mRNA-splicing factor cwc26 [Exophiala dermatitidis]
MPNSNLAAYLAKNYLTASTTSTPPDSDFADSTRPKKKRRKNKETASGGGGLIIADDDEDLSLRKGPQDQNDDNEIPIFETNVKSAEFRKKKGGSGWKVVSEPTTTTTSGNNHTNNNGDGAGDAAAAAEADRILAQAEKEARRRRREIEDEDAPAIVETDSTPVMASGVRAGLQTAEDTAALIAREQKESKKKSKSKEDKPQEEETIYRDATGRRIDISMKRAEARAAELERIKAEKKAREDAMGEVQRREKEARKQQLDEAKFMTLARGADDEEMNDMLRRQKRWDDPMAGYIAQQEEDNGERELVKSKTKARGKEKSGGGGGIVKTRKRVYAGHAPPNRYGILPGWRWDGVDRSTGFEKEWFQARSRSARVEELKYQWQMDE